MNLKSLYKAIDKAQVVSFDVFDTLLLYPYLNLADGFLHLERIHNRFGFAQRRLRAPHIFYLKHGKDREATLDDIYDQIPEFADMKQVELDWNLQILTANGEIKPFWDYAIKRGKTVIITSDIHLPQEFMERLLAHNGFTGYSKLFASASAGASKIEQWAGLGGGSLFDLAAKTLGVAPSAILHIGDSKIADYVQAKRHGFRVFLYETKLRRNLKINNKFKTLKTHLDKSLGLSVCAGLYLQREKSRDWWVEFGYKYAGPIIYAFSRFICNIAQDIPVDKILFIACDGYLPQKVFDTFNTGIPTSYVYAPRLLAWTAYFYPVYEAQAQRFCDYFHKDTGNLPALDFIDLNAEEFRRLASDERQKARWGDYIKSVVGEAKTAGVVVDGSGWYTAQRMIEKESGIKTVGFYYRTGLIECNPCKSFAYFSAEHKNIASSFYRIVEFVLSAPEPTAKTMTDGAVVYQTITAEEQKAIEIASKIEAGVMQFARDIKERFAGFDIYLSKADIITLSDVFLKNPSGEDVNAWLDVKQVDAGTHHYAPILAGRVPLYSVSRLKALTWRTPAQKVALVFLSPVWHAYHVAKKAAKLAVKLALRLVFGERYSLVVPKLVKKARRLLKR